VVDPESNATYFDYDALGRQTGMRDEAGRRVRQEYSAAGNLLRRVTSQS
jgi:YD repeat-containing protein